MGSTPILGTFSPGTYPRETEEVLFFFFPQLNAIGRRCCQHGDHGHGGGGGVNLGIGQGLDHDVLLLETHDEEPSSSIDPKPFGPRDQAQGEAPVVENLGREDAGPGVTARDRNHDDDDVIRILVAQVRAGAHERKVGREGTLGL